MGLFCILKKGFRVEKNFLFLFSGNRNQKAHNDQLTLSQGLVLMFSASKYHKNPVE